jgi:hypothetical protein
MPPCHAAVALIQLGEAGPSAKCHPRQLSQQEQTPTWDQQTESLFRSVVVLTDGLPCSEMVSHALIGACRQFGMQLSVVRNVGSLAVSVAGANCTAVRGSQITGFPAFDWPSGIARARHCQGCCLCGFYGSFVRYSTHASRLMQLCSAAQMLI